MNAAFEQARSSKRPAYGFIPSGVVRKPQAIIAVPIPEADPQLIVEAQLRFQPLEKVTRDEARKGVGVFLIDRQGKILWSNDGGGKTAGLGGGLLNALANGPVTLTSRYKIQTPQGVREVFAQVSAIPESGGSLVVQKPLSEAFADVDKLIVNAVLSTAVLVALSLFFAYLAARWVSQPDPAADRDHARDRRGELRRPGRDEGPDLRDGRPRRRLQPHERSRRRLRAAAPAGGAGEPRAVHRLPARLRGRGRRQGPLHPRPLRAGGGLQPHHRPLPAASPRRRSTRSGSAPCSTTSARSASRTASCARRGCSSADEYEQMKLHTVMGAEIMTPIEQLKEMIPAIRSHHEAWNGRGYPDGLKGEQIPLFARIVGVADTFDAITTNRPYQQAYSLQFAVETITRLTGSRFDAKIVTAFLRAFEAGDIRAGAGAPRAHRRRCRNAARRRWPALRSRTPPHRCSSTSSPTSWPTTITRWAPCFSTTTGETVDLACADFSPYEMRVIGAYLGIYLRQLEQGPRQQRPRRGADDPHREATRCTSTSSRFPTATTWRSSSATPPWSAAPARASTRRSSSSSASCSGIERPSRR